MTLVEVVVSMSILALTVAVTFAAISMSMKLINRAGDVKYEYAEVVANLQEKINDGDESVTKTTVSVSEVEGETNTKLADVSLKRMEAKPDSSGDNMIGSFYYYTVA